LLPFSRWSSHRRGCDGAFVSGRRGVITTFIVGILFSTVRIWTGNIVPAIVGHIGVDLVAGLYAPRALRTRPDRVTPDAPTAGEH